MSKRKKQLRAKARAKKKREHEETPVGCGAAGKPSLDLEQLEARVLLSATWVDADTDADVSDAASGDDVFADVIVDEGSGDSGGDELFSDFSSDESSSESSGDSLFEDIGDDLLDGDADAAAEDLSDSDDDDDDSEVAEVESEDSDETDDDDDDDAAEASGEAEEGASSSADTDSDDDDDDEDTEEASDDAEESASVGDDTDSDEDDDEDEDATDAEDEVDDDDVVATVEASDEAAASGSATEASTSTADSESSEADEVDEEDDDESVTAKTADSDGDSSEAEGEVEDEAEGDSEAEEEEALVDPALDAADATDAAPMKIVLVDSTLEDVDVLKEGADDDATIIEYDGANASMTDVLGQVESAATGAESQISSLTILSHGSGGQFDLGNEVVGDEMTAEQTAAWASLSDNFTDDGNIYAFGCNVVDGSGEGQALLNSLSSLTGTEVFGSDDITGAGGDWDLEAVSVGGEAELAGELDTGVDEEELADYNSDLADYSESGFSGTQSFTDGDVTFTVSVTGGGTIDFEYEGGDDKLIITGSSGTSDISITNSSGTLEDIKFETEITGGTVTIDATVEDIKFEDGVSNATVNISGTVEEVKFKEDLSNATVNVTGSLEDLELDADVQNSTVTVTGSVDELKLEESITGSTITISGDLNSIENDGTMTGTTVTANGVVGQFEVGEDGEDYSNTFANPTQVTFDGTDVTTGASNANPDAIDDSVTTNVNDAVTTSNVLANDTDGDGDTLSVTGFTQASNGTVVDNGDGTFTYTPNNGFKGSDSFTYTVDDGNGGTDTATVNVTVSTGPPINHAPTATAGSMTIDEDASATTVTLSGTEPDQGDNITSYRIDTVPANGTLTLNGVTVSAGDSVTQAQINSGNLTFTPTADFNGADSFTFSASDGDTWSDNPATLSITVNSVNDGPSAVADSVSTSEDTAVTTGNVLTNDSDPEGDSLSITGFTQGSNGTVADNGDGTFTYTPSANFNGSDSFTYTVDDGNGGTDTATVSVTVGAVNDGPSAVADSVSTSEDTAVTTGNVLTNDSDPDGDSLSITGFTQGSNGTVADNGDGTFTYTPNANFNGSDSFTYTVDDGNGGTDTATVSVTVGAANDGPSAVADSVSTSEDTAVTTGNVLTNDSDPEGDSLSITGFTQGSNGTVADNGDGTFTYTPSANFNGSDSFTYTVDDGNGGTSTATVNVTVDAAAQQAALPPVPTPPPAPAAPAVPAPPPAPADPTGDADDAGESAAADAPKSESSVPAAPETVPADSPVNVFDPPPPPVSTPVYDGGSPVTPPMAIENDAAGSSDFLAEPVNVVPDDGGRVDPSTPPSRVDFSVGEQANEDGESDYAQSVTADDMEVMDATEGLSQTVEFVRHHDGSDEEEPSAGDEGATDRIGDDEGPAATFTYEETIELTPAVFGTPDTASLPGVGPGADLSDMYVETEIEGLDVELAADPRTPDMAAPQVPGGVQVPSGHATNLGQPQHPSTAVAVEEGPSARTRSAEDAGNPDYGNSETTTGDDDHLTRSDSSRVASGAGGGFFAGLWSAIRGLGGLGRRGRDNVDDSERGQGRR